MSLAACIQLFYRGRPFVMSTTQLTRPCYRGQNGNRSHTDSHSGRGQVLSHDVGRTGGLKTGRLNCDELIGQSSLDRSSLNGLFGKDFLV